MLDELSGIGFVWIIYKHPASPRDSVSKFKYRTLLVFNLGGLEMVIYLRIL